MSDFAYAWPPLNVITPFSSEALSSVRSLLNANLGATTSSSNVANEALFFPFRLYVPAVAVKMSYLVGATATGNVDVGIYDWQKNLLVSSGSTAQGTINTLQTLDITDTALSPGRYFMAFEASTTGTAFALVVADEIAVPASAMYAQSVGSFPLPTTAAFAPNTNASPRFIAMGVHFSTLV